MARHLLQLLRNNLIHAAYRNEPSNFCRDVGQIENVDAPIPRWQNRTMNDISKSRLRGDSAWA